MLQRRRLHHDNGVIQQRTRFAPHFGAQTTFREDAFRVAERLLDVDRVCASLRGRGLAGIAGLALFFAAATQAEERAEFRAAMHGYFKAAAHAQNSETGLFNGLAGLVFALKYALAVEPRYAGLLDQCAGALDTITGSSEPRPVRTFHDYDLITGPAGVAVGASYGRAFGAASTSRDYLLHLLENDERWNCPHPLALDGPSAQDLGMAHGLAGMVAALALSAAPKDALRSAASKLAGYYGANDNPGFPSTITAGTARHGRSAWCYGTAGCASALVIAGRALDDPHIVSAGARALEALAQTPLHSWRLADSALCHGYSGNALCFATCAAVTENSRLIEVASDLLTRAAEEWQPQHPYGYQSRAASGEALDDPGLLTGSAGIGLALLTCAGACDKSWVQALGLPA